MKRLALLLPLLALAAAPAQAGFVVTNGAPVLRPEPPYVSCGYEEQRPNASAWRFSVSDAKPSPDGQFTAMVFAAGHEDHDWCARWLELRYPDGQSLWLGSSARGIGVKWWTTQIGPVLSIENDQDTHFSESIVLRPLGDRAADGFDVLYRTTDSALPLVEHSYTEVEDISVDGVLTLRHVWDYGPKQSGTGSGIWRIPLFLGRAIDPSMNSESSGNREIEETLTDRFLDASTIVRYERFSREDGDGETHAVSKADGDEILAVLKGWNSFEELRPKPRKPGEPCIRGQIRHPDLVLSCFRADGSSKSVRFFRIIDGSTKRMRLDIELPDVRWPRRVPDEPARAILAKLDAWSAADRAAFLAVPLPRTYVFRSTFWDGGTLSGVAKLFYGDGNKWRTIWEANKATVPDPNYLTSGTELVIPALATNAPALHAESAEGAKEPAP